jgi:hypothetical protein
VTTAFLGAKQEGLAIVDFLNKLIVSCKEAVRIPIFFVIFKLDSYFFAVNVRVNNHCPAFLKLVAIYSWLRNNCLCIERCSSQHMQQCGKNVFNI